MKGNGRGPADRVSAQPAMKKGKPKSGIRERVFARVRKIPKGRVMTYGQIAALLANRISAQAVGWMLHTCPDDVPWHRVVNASGGCSTERLPDLPLGLRRYLLERERVVFGEDGNLDLKRYRWAPRLRR